MGASAFVASSAVFSPNYLSLEARLSCPRADITFLVSGSLQNAMKTRQICEPSPPIANLRHLEPFKNEKIGVRQAPIGDLHYPIVNGYVHNFV